LTRPRYTIVALASTQRAPTHPARSHGHPQDRLDHLARLRIGEGLFDLAHVVVAHEAVEREAALLEELDERRDELPRTAAAAEHAHDPLAPQGAQVVEGEAGVRGRAADQDERAEHADGLRELLDHRDHARAV